MNTTITIAPVRKSILVQAGTQRAFEVFTAGIDRWWPRTHSLAAAPITRIVIDPYVGGRWYNDLADGTQVTVGHVRAWEPGKRFVVGWEISSAWKPDARIELASEVEVRFVPVDARTTRIEIEHRDFERMGAEGGEKMRGAVENGWPTLLKILADEIAAGTPASR